MLLLCSFFIFTFFSLISSNCSPTSPRPSPTENPSSTTPPPTKHPTRNPTATVNPTLRPTRTTASPTESPTNNQCNLYPIGDSYDHYDVISDIHFDIFHGLNINNDATPANIVLMIADDLGWNSVNYHGYHDIETPNIEYLRQNGVELNRFYVQGTCSPTRAALLTGKYPSRLGLQQGPVDEDAAYSIPIEEALLPEILNEIKGYKTALVGKWHLGYERWEYTPTERGFDYFYGCYRGAIGYNDKLDDGVVDLHENRIPVTNQNEINTYSTELFVSKSMDWIDSLSDNEPFFLQMAFTAPHKPFELPDPAPYAYNGNMEDSSNNIIYSGMVQTLDAEIGRFINHLKNNHESKWRNTLVIFFSDNGPNNVVHSYPLRGRKSKLWEGSVRVPAIIGGGLLETQYMKRLGVKINDLMHVTDIYSTVLEFAGIKSEEIDSRRFIDGIDQRNVILTGASTTRKEILLDIFRDTECTTSDTSIVDNDNNPLCGAIILDNYKLITGNGGTGTSKESGWSVPINCNGCITSINCKVSMCEDDVPNYEYFDDYALYNLNDDPCETTPSNNVEMYNKLLNRLRHHKELSVSALTKRNPRLDGQYCHIRHQFHVPLGRFDGECSRCNRRGFTFT